MRQCLFTLTPFFLFGMTPLHSSEQSSSPGIWEGIYIEAQAIRGQTVYQAECASCHRQDLTGQDMSPSLVGVGFSFKWQGRNVQELYASMRYGMPQTAPGSLSNRAYTDLTAFLLFSNGFPSGDVELSADEDELALIEITAKR
jgi:cytochrome c553